MDTLEQFFRFAGVSQLVILALVLLKDHRDTITGALVAVWALSGACYIAVVPAFRDWHWETASNIMLLGSLAWPVLFWLVAKALFQDDFRPGWLHMMILVASIVVSLLTGAQAFREGFAMTLDDIGEIIVPQTLVIVFVILALYVVLKDWRDDLVEPRRKLRFILLVATGTVALLTAAAVFALSSLPAADAIQLADTIHAGIVFALCVAVGLAFYRVPNEFMDPVSHRILETRRPDDFAPAIAELNRLTHDEKVYCQRGLTIGSLAAMLGEKEYRLRRIINGEFGYRNFNDFLNQYRVAEAARRLVASDTRKLPVLTIALDVGYSSLGPFNRAFKEMHGMTPTEYRATKRDETSV